MRHPWVNVLLLVLLAVLMASGSLGLVSGSSRVAWALWAHGAASYAVLAILGWKGAVVLRSLRRRSGLDPPRMGFFVLLVLFVGTLATGLLWSFGGRFVLFGYSLMTIHVVLSLGVLALVAWHAFAMRFVLRAPQAADRRAFLRLAVAAVAGVGLWRAAGGAMALLNLPGSNRRFTGSYETGSLTGDFPTVSWLFDRPSSIDRESWRLVIDGAVARPLSLTYNDIATMEQSHAMETLDCTGGWYSAQEWRGVKLDPLLRLAGLDDDAASVSIWAVSGYQRRFPIREAQHYLLATHVAGRDLSHGHGAPARLVAGGHRGYDWVKWVTHLQVNRTSAFWQFPVPLQ